MSKSMAQMADEILGGALTDPTKNPHDPNTGHQAHMPAMSPDDTLVEMSDAQRHSFLKGIPGIEVQELKEEVIREAVVEAPETPPVSVTPEEVDTLNEALRIIQKIQEATTVGNIGVNFAGSEKGLDPKKAVVPGNTNVSKAPKKREKKTKTKPKSHSDFLAYLKA
tara:strand:+ start:1108 stop:1605 length:498 start_codon:yes stop_codon:yes gene_type:complete